MVGNSEKANRISVFVFLQTLSFQMPSFLFVWVLSPGTQTPAWGSLTGIQASGETLVCPYIIVVLHLDLAVHVRWLPFISCLMTFGTTQSICLCSFEKIRLLEVICFCLLIWKQFQWLQPVELAICHNHGTKSSLSLPLLIERVSQLLAGKSGSQTLVA